MYDDPGLFLDAGLVAALGGFLSFLLFSEWRRAWRARRIDAPTLLGGISILFFLWFLVWMVSNGAVAHGLPALFAAALSLAAIPILTRRTR